MGWRGTVASVARGVRFWQFVRLGVAGRAWASLLGVLGGDVGRARMACGRCECGRRSGRRVTQKVGVMQHSAFRGTLGRQDATREPPAWRVSREGVGLGRGSRGMQVCGLHRVPEVTRWALRWKCGLLLRGARPGVWECEADGPSRGTFVVRTPGAGSASDGLVYARPRFQEMHRSCRRQELVGKVLVWVREAGGCRSVGCVVSRRLSFGRYAGNLGSCCGARPGVWECEADGPSCGRFVARTAGAGSAFDRQV